MNKKQLGSNVKYIANKETQVLVDIAKALYENGMVSSFRDFSKNWMMRNECFMSNLLFNASTKASVSSMVDLLFQLKSAPESQKIAPMMDKLSEVICLKVLNHYRRGGKNV